MYEPFVQSNRNRAQRYHKMVKVHGVVFGRRARDLQRHVQGGQGGTRAALAAAAQAVQQHGARRVRQLMMMLKYTIDF